MHQRVGGEGRIRTFVDVSQRIYSPSPLATRAPVPFPASGCQSNWSWQWDSNPQPADYKSAALPIELNQQLEQNGAVWHKQNEIGLSTRKPIFYLRAVLTVKVYFLGNSAFARTWENPKGFSPKSPSDGVQLALRVNQLPVFSITWASS